MTITKTELRTHVETDLADAAVDRLLADAYAFCAERVPTGEQTIVLGAGVRYLVLPAPVATAGDLEFSERFGDQTTLLVQDTDWRWVSGRIVERLSGGSLVLWGYAYGDGDVLVTYTPKDDTARRDRVVIDLVKLAVQYAGLSSERAGDYSAGHLAYAAEREKLVRQLQTGLAIA